MRLSSNTDVSVEKSIGSNSPSAGPPPRRGFGEGGDGHQGGGQGDGADGAYEAAAE